MIEPSSINEWAAYYKRQTDEVRRALTAERDQLRAEVAGMTQVTAELRAEVERLRERKENAERNWRLSQERATKWSQELITLGARAEAAERERDEARAQSERLRRALENLTKQLKVVHNSPYYRNAWFIAQLHSGEYIGPTYTEQLQAAESALSTTPAQALATVRAEAVREAANLIRQTTPDPTDFRRQDEVGRWEGRLYALEQLEAAAVSMESEVA